MDKFDDATKTLGYTFLAGDPRYSSFSAEIQFVAWDESVTDATWTAKYEPVGDMGPPEHIKSIAHGDAGGLPDEIWSACKQEDEILCKLMPEFFASVTMLHGHGEAGTIRGVEMGPVEMGPAIQLAGEVTERIDLIDFIDDASRKLGYTMVKGDPRYKYFAGTMQFTAGPSDRTQRPAPPPPSGLQLSYLRTSRAPPEHVKTMVSTVWKTLAAEVQTNPDLYA